MRYLIIKGPTTLTIKLDQRIKTWWQNKTLYSNIDLRKEKYGYKAYWISG